MIDTLNLLHGISQALDGMMIAYAGGGRSGFTYFPQRDTVRNSFRQVAARCEPDSRIGDGAETAVGVNGESGASKTEKTVTEMRSLHTNVLQLWHNLPQLRGARILLTVKFEQNPQRMSKSLWTKNTTGLLWCHNKCLTHYYCTSIACNVVSAEINGEITLEASQNRRYCRFYTSIPIAFQLQLKENSTSTVSFERVSFYVQWCTLMYYIIYK